ncbi:hypothetical protein SNS2_2536 [Streptomyces netropsis]|nr:hypothetical protein SNS2_2536 [Streptomyces netropsis]
MIWYGPNVLRLADALVEAYAEVFTAPPWNEDEESVRHFRTRLTTDAQRLGFRAAVSQSSEGIEGFATGWLTQPPFPTARAYGKVTAQLGPERVTDLLMGALEVDELAVRRRSRANGLGRRLLTELTTDAPAARSWLLTARKATATMATYHRLGWHELRPLPGKENDIAVFLAPTHPGATAGGQRPHPNRPIRMAPTKSAQAP